MKNLMQLKDLIKNLAKEKNINSQVLLRNYMMQRLLLKIANSDYKNNFILKGGMLVADLVGIESRSTVDMDLTMKSFSLSKDNITEIFTEIFSTKTEDGIEFKLKQVDSIREEAEYNGVRLAILALMGKARIPLKIDLTTGDKLTPSEINYKYQLLFEDEKIEILSYNLETLLAEKLETIVSRSKTNTRMRDFYDVYILALEFKKKINTELLAAALTETSKNRETYKAIKNGKERLIEVFKSEIILDHWNRYRKKFKYAEEIEFSNLEEQIIKLWNEIEDNSI
ncbi:nucleotidyl transferase AbiEii/AbiGii toxin family protein [Halanaerobium congolense]|jgi:predicted nucleotidyltransferase component of viral defense system|uniref:Predicted nucleotidyltransferase component of viral defense system n=1 Tax=Halanaerobium congolense TaxID=54121 RepID=A0A1G6TU61_9FIRM|nr:nucleotidyl transferase AbiEii/AbiGii toxin family protein [Halanaerobium congolense]SDD32620.1 Predicted nucleotidyltransferase component of viral defense system [Halanaerobium congolense]